MDVSVEGYEITVSRRSQRQRPYRVSRIEIKYSLEQGSMGKRLKIIETEKYNSAEALHIETRATGHRDMYASDGDGEHLQLGRLSTWSQEMRTGHRALQMGSQSGMHRDMGDDLRA